MSFRVVNLPGRITLVPARTLEGQLRRQASEHPGLPADPRQIAYDLNARRDGAALTFSAPRDGGGDWSLLVYTRTYVVRLFLTKRYQDAYSIAGVNPLRIRDHHRLAQGCLLVRPAGWQVVFDVQQIPRGSRAHWSRLVNEWERLTAALAERHGAPAVTADQAAFLDTLDQMINATERLETESVRSAPSIPYRDVTSTGERRYGTRAVYVFRVAGGRRPDEGAFVQVRGEPGWRGQVTRVAGESVTVRFDEPIDWARIPRPGELEVTPNTVVYDKQREAVALLRKREAHNAGLLSVVVDHRVGPIAPAAAEPTEHLDDDQLHAFRKALATRDILLVLGPPGTGKTRTISQTARACARGHGGRVLVTSHTNRAVDNVLGKLPPDIEAIRVGHEGSVTEEGRPYLLERRAAELREEIVRLTERSIRAYGDIDVAVRWARELGDRVDGLIEARTRETRARAKVITVRRAVGAAAQLEVDRLTVEHEKLGRRVTLAETWERRLSRLLGWARSRTGPAPVAFLLKLLVRIVDRGLETVRDMGERFRDAWKLTRDELAEAERELDAVTRDDPAVRAARAAVEESEHRRAECRTETVTAAHALRAGISGVEAPPDIRDGDRAAAEPEALEQDLISLRNWAENRMPLIANRPRLLADWRREVSGASDQLHPELIRYADVIAATCIGTASRPELSGVDFDLAIVDEAGQIGITDALVPLVRSRRGVLVGDHKQLPPFLDTEVEAWGAGVDDPVVRELLSKSALELLVEKFPGTHVVPLTWQRRMPSEIADFISRSFYEGSLHTAVEREHRDPLFRAPLAFIDTARLAPDERHEDPGHVRERWAQAGYINTAEAEILTRLAVFYHRRGAEWAIIVPYLAQVAKLKAALIPLIGDSNVVNLNVGSVDSFQGGERDVILYGFTRSNPNGRVGFLKELRRVNVAFTRAKHQLVLVGDMDTLTIATDRGFRELARSLRHHLAERGDIRQYGEVWSLLAEYLDG